MLKVACSSSKSASGRVPKLQECSRSRACSECQRTQAAPRPDAAHRQNIAAPEERERERERRTSGASSSFVFALMDCAPHALTAVFCLSTASRHNVNIISRSSGTPRDIFLLGVAVHLETSYSLAGWVMAKGEPLWSAFQLASACAQPQPVS